eukprot:gene5678-6863_t
MGREFAAARNGKACLRWEVGQFSGTAKRCWGELGEYHGAAKESVEEMRGSSEVMGASGGVAMGCMGLMKELDWGGKEVVAARKAGDARGASRAEVRGEVATVERVEKAVVTSRGAGMEEEASVEVQASMVAVASMEVGVKEGREETWQVEVKVLEVKGAVEGSRAEQGREEGEARPREKKMVLATELVGERMKAEETEVEAAQNSARDHKQSHIKRAVRTAAEATWSQE